MSSVGWEPRKLGNAASAHLDWIRAIASWAVMWGHVRALFFVDFPRLQESGWFLGILYFLTGFGHQAVMFFFVLSGFLISSTVIKSHFSGTWSWRDYAINRGTRLYVVLIPGLLFGAVWDLAGSAFSPGKGIYSHSVSGFGAAVPLQNLSVTNLVGNLFFLQTILCSTFGSNGPLWSLANEFWYYALFPLGLSAGFVWRKRSLASVLLSALLAVLAVAVCVLTGRAILLGFLTWLAGCGLVLAHSRLKILSKGLLLLWLIVTFSALSGLLIAVRIGQLADAKGDLLVGAAFALSLFFVLQVQWGASSAVYIKLSHVFAGFSYSLYVLHFPLLFFLRSWMVPDERWQPNAFHLFCAFGIGLGALTFSWLVSLFTENKTRAVRNIVLRFSARLVPDHHARKISGA